MPSNKQFHPERSVGHIASKINQILGFKKGGNGCPTDAPVTHPFDSIRFYEIAAAAKLVRENYGSDVRLHFKSIDLLEPRKAEMVPYLEAEHVGKVAQDLPTVARKVLTSYSTVHDGAFYETVVDLTANKVESSVKLPPEFIPRLDHSEIKEVEQIIMEDEGVKEEIRKLELPEGTVVVCEPWMYGKDGTDDSRRLWQGYMYMRDPNSNHVESNHYAFPLDFSPVVDHETKKVKRIMRLPLGPNGETSEEGGSKEPWKGANPNEYHPELLRNYRTDLKPYNVIQPDGPSYRVSGELVEWQKWRFRVGFNDREGMVIRDVYYDNRSLFYRLSMSEMFVPYGHPFPPYHRKGAFDFGDNGAGVTANNLKLGCDCLGTIHYFTGVLSDVDGEPYVSPNVICLHEEDQGIGWKHTNYRTECASVIRARVLVLQSIITVANYEYIFLWRFGQAADISFEVRATGILSTSPIKDGVTVPYGTVVSKGVLAAYHQHLFSIRIDPAIESHTNTVVYEDSVPMDLDEKTNPYGVGYVTEQTPIKKSGYFDLDISKNRVVKIINSNVKNPVNNLPVGYKLYAHPSQLILSHPTSFNAKRAEFASHAVWVTKYHDDELYSASKYTNQSCGGHGISDWVAREEDTENQDVVLFHSFGLTHNPRVEDFPVMPCENISIELKPNNFFDKNPALDVPQSEQHFNKSTLAASRHHQGTKESPSNPR